MPNLPNKICKHPGCTRLAVKDGYCERHWQREPERKKPFHDMYGRKWQKASKTYLAEHPWCVECLKHGVYTPAIVVDHIKPHKGNIKLFWDTSNWQGLCKHCHDVKTAKEDGGFGHPQRRKQ